MRLAFDGNPFTVPKAAGAIVEKFSDTHNCWKSRPRLPTPDYPDWDLVILLLLFLFECYGDNYFLL